MSDHQHAPIEYEEEKQETIEYRSLQEAIEKRKEGVKLVVTYTKQLDDKKKEMHECSENLVNAMKR